VAGRCAAAVAALLAAAVIAALPAGSAPRPQDPDWPCQQRLVPKLVAASYWNGPPPAAVGDWRADPEVAQLVERLAPRRVSTEAGLAAIEAFAHAISGDRARHLALAFQGLLDETNRERSALIDELKGIGRRQRELAELVGRLGTALDAVPPDATGEAAARRIDLEQRYNFSALNFEEIQRTIRYACDTPVALDARLGAWARALQKAASV
jgi:hypothetical protein